MDYWKTLLIEEERKVEIAIEALEKLANDNGDDSLVSVKFLGAQQLAKEALQKMRGHYELRS